MVLTHDYRQGDVYFLTLNSFAALTACYFSPTSKKGNGAEFKHPKPKARAPRFAVPFVTLPLYKSSKIQITKWTTTTSHKSAKRALRSSNKSKELQVVVAAAQINRTHSPSQTPRHELARPSPASQTDIQLILVKFLQRPARSRRRRP